MNYISEINAFERWLEMNYLPTQAQLLWYKMMYYCNRLGYPEWFCVDNRRMMATMQISREATFIDLRNRLVNAGLIQYQKGKKGSPNRYKIITFTTDLKVNTEDEPVTKAEIESKHKTETDKNISNTALTEEIPSVSPLKKTIEAFIQNRKDTENPMTPKAIELMVKKLNKMASSDDEKIAILEKSIRNGWKDLFPLNSGNEYSRNGNGKPKLVSAFNDFDQREYDYDDLLKQLKG